MIWWVLLSCGFILFSLRNEIVKGDRFMRHSSVVSDKIFEKKNVLTLTIIFTLNHKNTNFTQKVNAPQPILQASSDELKAFRSKKTLRSHHSTSCPDRPKIFLHCFYFSIRPTLLVTRHFNAVNTTRET